MSYVEGGSHIESHILQDYSAIGARDESNNHSRTRISHSVASELDVEDDSDSENAHLPSRVSHGYPSRRSTSTENLVVPLPTGNKTRTPKAGAKKLSNMRRIIFHGLARCIISWILVAGFYVSLWLIKGRVISPRAKSAFDAITVALSIAFGLNIASSLKEIALDFRWWILDRRLNLGRKQISEEEVAFILKCDSMTTLLKMMWTEPRFSTIVACTTWLAVNMIVQIGLASLGLTYSASPGPEDVYLGASISNISVPDFTRFTPSSDRLPGYDLYGEAYAAHLLGDIATSYNYSMLPDIDLDGSSWATNPAAFWNATTHWEYVSLNSTPSNVSGRGTLSVYTNRVISSSGVCTTPAYRLDSITVPGIFGDNVTVAQFTWLDGGKTVNLPVDALNLEGTYYLSSPMHNRECGPGCGSITVVEAITDRPGFKGQNGQHFYLLFVFHQASLTARAIALSGAIPQLRSYAEYVFYQLSATFGEAQNNSTTGMASQISRFAIGVIAAAAQTGQSLIIQGHVPTQGLRLTLVYPIVFDLILGLIAGLQLVLVVFTAIACKDLAIPEE